MAKRRADETARLMALSSRYGFLPLLWWEMYWAALETIGYRMAGMAAAGFSPNATQQRENFRMVQEKAEAGMESARALATPNPALPLAMGQHWLEGLNWGGQLYTQPQQYVSMALGWPLLMAESAADAFDVAVNPWHRRVTANARRLRKKRR